MENSERETRDFMNVESFSQLPFLRPAPAKEKGIRLFGKDFVSASSNGNTVTAAANKPVAEDRNPNFEDPLMKDGDNVDSSRKFECHYCCRNFPTSQALGGHQNAHKRERQQAKRAHLQSTAAIAHGGYYTCHRLGSAPPPPPAVVPFAYHSQHHYQLWNGNASSATNPRFYCTTHPPITGSPQALWRIPSVQNPGIVNYDRSLHHRPLPSFVNDELKHTSSVVSGSSNSQTQFIYEAKSSNVQDPVSLDLRL